MVKKKNKAVYIPLWTVTVFLAAAALGWYALGNRPQEAVITPLGTDVRAEEFSALDLNEATAAELEELPGIGAVLGSRIIAWREENGPFTGPEDVMAVPGIGPATWEAIAPYIDFS